MNVQIKVEGVTPLLCNRFSDEAQMDATNGARAATAVADRGTPEEQCESRLYKDSDGTVVLPQPNLLRCIIDAGKFFKAGRAKVTTQKSSLIPSCVGIDSVVIPLLSKNGWSVDARPVRIPATGGRIIRYRPIFYDWGLEFVAELDTTEMSKGLFREIVDAAGKKIGLGDFRPDCKGPFGKFCVVSWTEE